MRTALRRLATTAALALVAGGIVVPVTAGPAAAVTPAERVWSVVGVPGTLGNDYGLYLTDSPGGTRTKVEGMPVVEGQPSTSVFDLSASGDGSRVVYVRDSYAADFTPLKEEVVVRDTSSRRVRVLESLSLAGSKTAGAPVLSPDGTRAAWEIYDEDLDELYVRVADVGSGTSRTISAGHTPYAFLTNDTLLVQTGEGVAYTQPFAGGALTAVTNLPVDAIDVTVSPDGTKLAWGLLDTAVTPIQADLQVAPVQLSGATATVGAATTVDTTLFNAQPAFSRDGATVFWTKLDIEAQTREIWSATVSDPPGTPAAVTATPTEDELDVAVTSLPGADTTAPAAATAQPGVISGKSAVVKWSLPADTDLSGVLIARAGKEPVYVPAPQTALVDTGLVIGTTYTYTITAVDRSGNSSAPVEHRLTAIQPGAYFGNPTSAYSTKTSFPVRFATGAQATTTFYVDYLPYGGTLRNWVNGATGAFRTFGAPASTGVASTSAVAGGTYTFRVKVVDEFGNASGYVGSGKAVVPWDQSKAVLSGGTNVASGSAYLGSFRRLSTTAHYARVSLVGNQLTVVGWRCKTCGKLALYDGATRIATIDTYSATLKARVVLFSKTYASTATHTYTIRPLGTAGRPYVALDGFAMRR